MPKIKEPPKYEIDKHKTRKRLLEAALILLDKFIKETPGSIQYHLGEHFEHVFVARDELSESIDELDIDIVEYIEQQSP